MTALGMVTLNLIGGILNGLRLAFPVTLIVLCATGFLLAGFYIFGRQAKMGTRRVTDDLKQAFSPHNLIGTCVPLILILVLLALFGLPLMPTAAFNYHDDYHVYLVRPIRMLATGTVGDNPFDLLGLDGLGSQSFFQAFTLACGPVDSVNAFDAVFCFGLGAWLLADFARTLRIHWGLGALAVLTYAFINPQYVNISPLYSGSLMVAGLVMSSWLMSESIPVSGAEIGWRSLLPMALFLSALASFKTILAFFAVFYFVVFWVLSAVSGLHLGRVLRATARTGVMILLAVSPWLLVSVPVLIKARRLGDACPANADLTGEFPSLSAHDIKGLFTFDDMYYGGNQWHYNLIILVMALAAALACVVILRRQAKFNPIGWACLGAVSMATVPVYFLNAHLFDVKTALRYACPILIGAFPVGMLLATRVSKDFCDAASGIRERTSGLNVPTLALVSLQLVVLFVFLVPCVARLNRASQFHTILSFDFDPNYLDYNRRALSQEEEDRIRMIQGKMDCGRTILAWIALPMHLDFTRNRILTTTEGGIVNPWLKFPVGVDENSLRKYLQSWGIRYVLLEVEGYGVKTARFFEPTLSSPFPLYRKMAKYNTYLRQALLSLSEKCTIVHQDSNFVVFDIGPAT
ncbi:MAG TPA: hypothetical protein P5205_02310 [Candidatus Paceibacterota bacterium]|nr:hypothetical protein [Candidatus Paceibacterota bacterium]